MTPISMHRLLALVVAVVAFQSFQAMAQECSFLEKTYQSGESWNLENCATCICVSGSPRCSLSKNCVDNGSEEPPQPRALACDSNPCQNDGTCEDTIHESYVCSCLASYSGRNCEDQELPEGPTASAAVTEKPCISPSITKHYGQLTHKIEFGSLKLKCRAEGYPQPTISWSPIPDNERFIVNSRGTLNIKSPTVADSGVYTCTATNVCGNSSTKTKLTVVCAKPTITGINDSAIYDSESGDLQLRCRANGDPKPNITWSSIKNDRFIVNPEGTLIIQNAIPGDVGNYTCTASNECGNHSVTKIVTVRSCSRSLTLTKGQVEYEGNETSGTIAAFYCNPEHELNGPAKIRCLPNGKWNETLPECLPFRQCSQPKDPRNGRVINRQPSYAPQERAEFECNKGYVNRGSTFRLCLETLKWSQDKPQCRKKKRKLPMSCGDPGNIENGFKMGSVYNVKSIVYYACNQGYFIYGPSRIQCLPTGRWSYLPPRCELTFQDLDLLVQEFADAIDSSREGSTISSSGTDLIFLLDKSGSVSNADFRLSLQFVKDTVRAFEDQFSDVRFSLVTYSQFAKLESNFTSSSRLKKVIRDVRRRTYGSTATRRAFDVVRDGLLLYNRHCYDCTPPTKRPDRDFYTYPCPTCYKQCLGYDCSDCWSTIVFLVTDGQSNWAGDPRHAAECLKSNGVEIFSVGVSSHINIAELRDIASEPLHSHLFLIRSFEDAVKLVNLAKKRFK